MRCLQLALRHCRPHSSRSATAAIHHARSRAGLIALVACWSVPAAGAPFAYIPNRYANTVSVLDTATNIVVGAIPVVPPPWAVTVTPDGTRAYLTGDSTNGISNALSVLDTATNTIVATVPVPYGGSQMGVAVNPAGTRV